MGGAPPAGGGARTRAAWDARTHAKASSVRSSCSVSQKSSPLKTTFALTELGSTPETKPQNRGMNDGALMITALRNDDG